MRVVKWDITTNTNDVRGTIREYFKSLQSNKFENLEEIDKFLYAATKRLLII
jgi:hypothetical protein